MSNLTTASLRRRWTKLIMCLLLSSLLVAPASLAQQPQEPYLVTDINQQSVGSNIDSMTPVGDRLFFFADDGWHGREVRASDGTEAGTRLVVDLNPGSAASVGMVWQPPAAVNGTLFFSAMDGPYAHYKLWASDGTGAGTRLVADINPGGSWTAPGGFTPVGDTLFFIADDGVHGYELWALPLPPLAPRMYLPLIRR